MLTNKEVLIALYVNIKNYNFEANPNYPLSEMEGTVLKEELKKWLKIEENSLKK